VCSKQKKAGGHKLRLFIYSLLLLGLLAGAGIVYFRHETQAAEQTINMDTPATQGAVSTPARRALPTPAYDSNRAKQIDRILAREMNGMRSLTDRPEEANARTLAAAQDLNQDDCLLLERSASDSATHPDKRFAAAYLLSKAKPAVAVDSLIRIATTPIADDTREHMRFERILRSLAVEGLSTAQGSQEAEGALVLLAQGHSALRLRARQALDAFLGNKPSVKQQDEAMLTKLVDRGDSK